MSYTVFKDTNNHSITAPNETGEIVLKSSIPRQIRIEVDRNIYKFYDIAEKKYLNLTEIRQIDPERCFFTASIYPLGETYNPALADSKENYPIIYKFIYSCLGSTFSDYSVSPFNDNYCSNNIYFSTYDPKTIEFEFHSHITNDLTDVKIRLNLSPSDTNLLVSSFSLTSNDVEIISLFQHNITIDASYNYVLNSTTQSKNIYSLSFSLINNRYGQYDKSGLTTSNQVLSLIKDFPRNKNYPASGLIYMGRYSNGASTMNISVYTITNIRVNSNNSSSLFVTALFTGKESGSSSSTTVDSTTQSLSPSVVQKLTFSDDVIQLS